MLCCSLFACKLCVLCWWWWYKQKVLNYIHSSTACLVCTIILTVSDFLYLKKVLRTRLNNLLFYFCMLKIVLFHCLAFYICPWFVLVSSRLFLFAREAWIEGNQFEIMHCGLKWGKKDLLTLLFKTIVFIAYNTRNILLLISRMANAGKCSTLSHLTFFSILKYKILCKNTKNRLMKLLWAKVKIKFHLTFFQGVSPI